MTREEFIIERTRIISDMLDNPSGRQNGLDIYPTTKCFNELDALYDKLTQPIKEKEDNSDTKKCHVCGGRTALVTGYFNYEPDREPYQSGIEEESMVTDGECWVGGYKCDDCGNVQGLWQE